MKILYVNTWCSILEFYFAGSICHKYVVNKLKCIQFLTKYIRLLAYWKYYSYYLFTCILKKFQKDFESFSRSSFRRIMLPAILCFCPSEVFWLFFFFENENLALYFQHKNINGMIFSKFNTISSITKFLNSSSNFSEITNNVEIFFM